jgi:hypothetical protein
MNGYIIETTRENEKGTRGPQTVQWIGIRKSAKDMISVLPGHSPSVVDRGPGILVQARLLGLQDGEFQEFTAD